MSQGASPSPPQTKHAIPIPNKARPVAHRVMRSKSLSASGRLADESSMHLNSSECDGLATAPFFYEGAIRTQILRLKYANQRPIARQLARYLVIHIQERIGGVGCIVTWAPTLQSHRRKRGIDQAELLAWHVARELDMPCRELLIRLNTESQTGKSRATRLVQPLFRARAPSDGAGVLVIDDVITTGSTMRAATEAFRQVGVSKVFCVAVAKTRGSRAT